MLNINGQLLNHAEAHLGANNRGLHYGDAVFETIKYAFGKLLFWEDHYFRLMASMRILRMEIPMNFTPEFLEAQILELIRANDLEDQPARIKLLVNRGPGGYYSPKSKEVEYLITSEKLEQVEYYMEMASYRVDLFKDFMVSPGLMSSLKTNNKALHVVGSIFASENDLDNCILLNTDKHIIEALNGNLFLVQKEEIVTPPISDGCLNGIIRKQLLKLAESNGDITITERSISPFEIQQSDEFFITNVIKGIQPVTNYRKKEFVTEQTQNLLEKLNEQIRSN